MITRWTEQEKAFVRENADKLTIDQMADILCRSAVAVKLCLHRNRIPLGNTVKRNLVIELLKLRYKNPEDFSPSKSFYQETKFTPQRWWDLYLGKKQIAESEYIKLSEYFNISLSEAFETRQLSLFDAGGGDGITKNKNKK